MRQLISGPVKARLLASVMLAGLVAACSSDVARFNDNPFQNPFNSRTAFDPASTASINRGQVPPTRLTPVSSSPVTSQPLPAASQPMMRTAALGSTVATASAAPALLRTSAPAATGSVAAAAYPALAPVAPRATTALGATQGWTAVGGTPVTLQPGESIAGLSGRYGVPVSALLAVNGLSSASAAQPGQQIMIPAYSAVQGASAGRPPISVPPVAQASVPKQVASTSSVLPSRETIVDAPRAAPVSNPATTPRPAAAPVVRQQAVAPVVAAPPMRAPVRDVTGRTETDAEKRAAAKLRQIRQSEAEDDEQATVPSRLPQKPPISEKITADKAAVEKKRLEAQRAAAEARKLEERQTADLRATEVTKAAEAKKLADAKKAAEARKLDEAKKAEEAKALAEAKRKAEAAKLAARRPAAPASVEPVTETTASIPEQRVAARTPERPTGPSAAAPAPVAQQESEASNASFRWPAQGRVITGYGGRSASGANDGINIAVPEGTPVKAAEGGTVIHADDALKGYGKLVLVRHANGFVTVYAHNGEIKVKRGENVKRGQVIAASGSSGNVTSPQLHFQIRKGAQAVDPMKHLANN
ncbi:NlpD Membrane proteins related to metalloendopeptidases [Rhabdaerophilaceae bacterium]